MAEENENEVSAEGGDKKKKKIPTVVIIAVIAVLMLATGVFVGKMMFGGGTDDNSKKIDKVKTKGEKIDKEKDKKEGDKKKSEDVKKEDKGTENDKAEDNTKKDDAEKKTEEKKDGEKNGTASKPETKKKGKGNLKLEEFLVNLNDPLVRRYVKFIINLRLIKATYVEQIKGDENIIPEIRDKIFELVSDKSYTDLKSSAGKVMLKEEIMISINEILKDNLKVEPVIKVMFSKFILQ